MDRMSGGIPTLRRSGRSYVLSAFDLRNSTIVCAPSLCPFDCCRPSMLLHKFPLSLSERLGRWLRRYRLALDIGILCFD